MTQKQPEKNMCDGCQRGLPIKEGDHYTKEGRIVMGCTKKRYISQPEKCESCLVGFTKEDIGGNCTCSQPPVPEWEKEFDYLVDPENYCDCGNINLDIEKVKGFIVKTIQSVRNQTLEEAAMLLSKSMPPYYSAEFGKSNFLDVLEVEKKNLDIEIQNRTLVIAQSIIRSLTKY